MEGAWRGHAPTSLGRDARGALLLLGTVPDRVTPGPDAGADTPAWPATSSEIDGVSGRFFARREVVDTAPHATDTERCDRLGDAGARLAGLSPEL